MVFMVGSHPIRRTLRHLKNSKIILRETVRIFAISYNKRDQHHTGASDFVFWNLPQIQYNNPTVQCISFKNMTPTPFIEVYFEDGKSVLIDLDSRNREDIESHLEKFAAITKTKEEIKHENSLIKKKYNPAYFGCGCERQCICEIFGQVPCPRIVKLPNHWRGNPPKNPKLEIPPVFRKWGQEWKKHNM